jgi:fatty acid desaturase
MPISTCKRGKKMKVNESVAIMGKHKPIPWQLGIFPLLELVFFLLANLADHYFISFVFVLVASLLLSFGIHIFFHECVHTRENYSSPVNILFTIFLGFPFDGYRIHHLNHHTHSNGLNDFSSTWRLSNGKKIGYSTWNYSVGWLRQVQRAIHAQNPFDTSWGDVEDIKIRIQPQKVALFLFVLSLAFIGLKAFVLYLVLIYFGWAFTSLHNYGQHPPIDQEPVCTYSNKTFNYLFFNNGLHWEHHDKPWLSWNQIKLDSKSPRIHYAHLINPCLVKNNER